MLDLMDIKTGLVHPASYVSLHLRQMYKDKITGENKSLGWGTGFIYQASDKKFLITNWHIVTGCNPDTNQLMPGYKGAPEWLEFCVATRENRLHFLPGIRNLYENKKPCWHEINGLGYRADIAAIAIEFPEDAYVVPINNACASGDLILDIGQEVFIVGYPFIQSEENIFPIWKRATIGSEPSLLLQKKLRFYLDTPGRPGMSGSPVYVVKKGLATSKEIMDLEVKLSEGKLSVGEFIDGVDPTLFGREMNILHFAGIYSGSYGDKNLDALNLGFCWNGFLIQKLFENNIGGTSPHNPYNL